MTTAPPTPPPGPPPYYPQPPPGYFPPAAPEKFVGMAWAAVILGIIGVVFSWIPFLNVLTMLGALVGVVLGVIALFGSRKAAAGIGVGLCVLAVVFSSLVMSAIASVLDTAQGSSSVSSSSDSGYSPAPVAPPASTGPVTTFGEGTYEVGTDIQPGTYKTAGPASGWMKYCYWERQSATDGEFSSIIANEGGEGPTTVTISPSDAAFKTSGCEAWTKVR